MQQGNTEKGEEVEAKPSATRSSSSSRAVTQCKMSYDEASSVGVEVAGPRLRRHQGGRECYSTGLAGPNT